MMRTIEGTDPLPRQDAPAAALAKPADLHDLRFRALLGEAGWNRLPPPCASASASASAPAWP